MFGRKHEVLDEPQSIRIQTPPYDRWTVLFYKLGEIVRIDDSFFNTGGFHNAAFEPTVIDPLLHLVASDMQGFRQAVNREPIATSLRAFAQAMQHGANGVWRALHDLGNLFDEAAFGEIKKPLLFGLCPGAPRALLCYTMLT